MTLINFIRSQYSAFEIGMMDDAAAIAFHFEKCRGPWAKLDNEKIRDRAVAHLRSSMVKALEEIGITGVNAEADVDAVFETVNA